MRVLLLCLISFYAISCMKSRKEYEEAISDVRQEEQAREDNPQRSRGSNDREGMGADE